MQTVELPSQSESLVPVRVEGLQPTIGRWGILEPGGDGLHGIAGVLAGRTLVDLLKPTVPARLLNLAEKEQRIRKGTAIVVCVAVQSIMPGKDCSRWQHTEDLPEHLRDLYRRSSENLTPAQKAQVHNLLCQYSDVFSKGPQDMGKTEEVQHHINTQDAAPIRQPPRRLPLAKQQDASQAIEEMRRDGVIEPSVSPWASPIVIVKKKDGSTRFCVD